MANIASHLFFDIGLLQSVVFFLVERQQGKGQQNGHDATAHEQHLHAAKCGVGFIELANGYGEKAQADVLNEEDDGIGRT